nr:MAG TPA: hypothetical protein [Caudoviricetes sp.]
MVNFFLVGYVSNRLFLFSLDFFIFICYNINIK